MMVCVFDAGCVGLVTAAWLADMGDGAVCIAVDAGRVEVLQRGETQICEPGLAEPGARNVAAGRLHFTTDAAEDGSADLAHVLAAASTIGRHMLNCKVVVDKSTVPLGTGDTVRVAIAVALRRRSADMTKYVANSMLATRISTQFLYAGCGWGGSCLPKDVSALRRMGAQAGVAMDMIEAVNDLNVRQCHLRCQRLVQRYGESLQGLDVGVWGPAFKPGTDDLRLADNLVGVDQLLCRSAQVRALDPVFMPGVAVLWPGRPGLERVALPLDATTDSSALRVVAEGREFRSPDFDAIRARMKVPLVPDGRNRHDPARLAAFGFEHMGIGRGAAPQRLPVAAQAWLQQAA